MRLVTCEHNRRTLVGAVTPSGVIATDFEDMVALIRSDVGDRTIPEPSQPLRGERIRAPIPRPGKILCCGVNYYSHVTENPQAILPNEPFFFAKLPSAVIGPEDSIILPTPHSQIDYEVELAVVIGRRTRGVKRHEALEHVFGYTIVNDVSARDVQFKDSQITLGKGFDTFCPMGPVVVTADEIPDPSDLRLTTRLNGEIMQDERASSMLFDVPALLETLSAHITLEPGDVVTTGTPAGVGHFRDPPVYLAQGDVVEVEIERIGTLRNPVSALW